MPKIVAVRKESRLQDTLRYEGSIAEKRQNLVLRGEGTTERSEELVDSGFREIFPPTRDVDVLEATSETTPSFSRLGYVGAYIINAPNEAIADKARETLDDDYFFLPNFSLSLPTVTKDKQIQPTPQRRKNTQWSPESGVEIAHNDGITGFGVLVGVLDTGCNAHYDEFKDRNDAIEFVYADPQKPLDGVANAAAFDIGEHGTHVCGIIAGKHIGIAPDVNLMVASVVDSNSRSTLERMLYGLNWMLARFKDRENLAKPMLINVSLGIPAHEMETEFGRQGMRLRRIFDILINDYEVLPIVAIGNEGKNKLRAPGYYPSVLSVGAVNFQHQPTEFTSYGISPDDDTMRPNLVGYGANIYSSLRQTNTFKSLYGTLSGTSMAAPYVTGIAALYASKEPHLRGLALRDKLLDTALALDTDQEKTGRGLARYVEG